MNVKYSKTFFFDLEKITKLDIINDIEFISDFTTECKKPEEIPGFKWLRQYKSFGRIEVAPYRIGVMIIGDTVIFKRVLHRTEVYRQFP